MSILNDFQTGIVTGVAIFAQKQLVEKDQRITSWIFMAGLLMAFVGIERILVIAPACACTFVACMCSENILASGQNFGQTAVASARREFSSLLEKYPDLLEKLPQALKDCLGEGSGTEIKA